jgi:hypothetical protein
MADDPETGEGESLEPPAGSGEEGLGGWGMGETH